MEGECSRLIVIAGPTACGKTAAAVRLAQALDGELIGADSVQVYRRLSIGSARPTLNELQGVPHHLLGIAELTENFDAGRYITLADAAIADVRARHKIPIVVGGTGLYLRALVHGLADGIPADVSVRAALQSRIDVGGREELSRMHTELTAVDPDYAAKIHPTDPIRIVRALEVWTTSGIPLSVHHRRHQQRPRRYTARFMVITVDPPVLHARIAQRTRAMLSAGMIDEVKTLLAEGIDASVKPLRSVGYAQVVAHLQHKIPLAGLEAAIVHATVAFARRQRTWFRGEANVTPVVPEALWTQDLLTELRNFMAGETPPSPLPLPSPRLA